MIVIILVVLVVDALGLAAVEVLYLPLRVGAVPFPITILLAAVSTPWLVRSAAELGGPRVVAAVPLVVWALAFGVLGLGGLGGGVALPADWRPALLLGGGMIPAAVMLGRALARSSVAGPLGDTWTGVDTVQLDGPSGYRE
jgi:hypothetical protein